VWSGSLARWRERSDATWESTAEDGSSTKHEARYDNGLICGGTLEWKFSFELRVLPPPDALLFRRGMFRWQWRKRLSAAGFGMEVVDDRERLPK